MTSNAYQVVRDFESAVAEYAGCSFAVAVESGSAAIFLSLYMRGVHGETVDVPRFTYPSVPNALVHVGGIPRFIDLDWQDAGWYHLAPTTVVDSCKMMAREMYREIASVVLDPLVCLSFHAKKAIPIGRGGMILCSSLTDAERLRCLRFDGRHEMPLPSDEIRDPGWNMYMTPEQAARGLEFMQWIPDKVVTPPDPYMDLQEKWRCRRGDA